MAVQEKLLTADEFWELYGGKPCELIHGKLVPIPAEVTEVMPGMYTDGSTIITVRAPLYLAGMDHRATLLHGVTAMRVAAPLFEFVDTYKLGGVVSNATAFRLEPNTLVRIDLAYLSNRKLAFITDHEKYVPFAPDLAVEIVSQRDMATELQEKIDLYLNTGTPLVWIFYPDLEQVMVHRADRTSTTILRDGFLDGEDVLPGLKIAVADLFPPSSQPSSQSASEPPADS